MDMALAEARQAAESGEVPVGAVVVRQGQVIATGRNAPIDGHDPTAHAEIVALRAAALAVGNYRLDECELFVTLEPCAMCSGAMLNARLKRVVFGAHEPKTGAAGSVIDLFAQTQLNHQTELMGGVLEEQSRVLLQEFFLQRRAQQREISVRRYPLREDALRTPELAFQDLPGYPWQPHYINDLPALAGLRLHYLDDEGQGGESGPALTYFCLHGDTGWSYEFRNLIPLLLQTGHRVIAPDLAGFGKSDKPKKASFHTFIRHRQILLELVERLDLTRIVLVVSARSGLLGFTLPMAAPRRYQNLLRITNTSLTGQDMAFSAGYPVWQQMLAQTPEAANPLKASHDKLQISVEETAASQLPFPDKGYRAALLAFPNVMIDGETIEGKAVLNTANQFWFDRWVTVV